MHVQSYLGLTDLRWHSQRVRILNKILILRFLLVLIEESWILRTCDVFWCLGDLGSVLSVAMCLRQRNVAMSSVGDVNRRHSSA